MFKDQSYQAEGFESSWRNAKQSCNESSQTTEFETRDQGTSTAKSISVRTQTEKKSSDVSTSVDMNKLATWLNSVCPNMLNELKDESISHAMSSVKLDDGEIVTTAKMLQEIDVRQENEQDYHVSGLSWNSTGNTLAASCSFSHESWCLHEGLINLYTFNRDDVLPSKPSRQLRCTACIRSLSFHPTEPSIICAATHSGEILLWNNQKDDGENLIASKSEHDECINLITWVTNLDSKPMLVSAANDSYLILWSIDVEESSIVPKQKFTTGKINKSISSPEVYSNKSDGGILQFDFSPHIPGLFVLGMEGGTVIKCSITGAKSLSSGDGPVGSILDPTVSYYEKHEGEITSIKFSPHRKDLFLSCATDDEIRIFHLEQATPVQIIFMDMTLHSVSWVIHEEKLLVGCSNNGSVRLYSLLNGQLIPKVSGNLNKDPFFEMAINKKRADIVVFGNNKGQIQLWSFPWNNIATEDSYNVYGKGK